MILSLSNDIMFLLIPGFRGDGLLALGMVIVWKQVMRGYSPNQINCTVLIPLISLLLTSKNKKPLWEIEAFEKTKQSTPNRAKSVEAFRSTKLPRTPPQNQQWKIGTIF